MFGVNVYLLKTRRAHQPIPCPYCTAPIPMPHHTPLLILTLTPTRTAQGVFIDLVRDTDEKDTDHLTKKRKKNIVFV